MTATTLTDRYISAVVRGVPEKQRADLEQELRASLADAIDARLEAGADAKTAEYEAVTELGDPIVLSARYAGRPLHLIGPALYPDWKRLLTVLEFIVVPIVFATLTVVGVLKGDEVGGVIGGAVWTALSVAVFLAFWVTVVFAVIERTAPEAACKRTTWNPDMLPETSARLTSRTEFVVETTLGALVITAFLLSPFVSPHADAAGAPIPFFHPWIWQSGLVVLLVLVPLLQVGANVLKLRGRWTMPLAIGATVVDVVGAIVLIVLASTDHVLNPAFFAAAGWPASIIPVVNVILVIVAALSIATSAWENIRSVRKV
ncbi:permease prefix domain 1-containing protein [Protaetiibacter intestinalis]|uniref:Uncharacterized protein n=1 Tax=Protaetiibacter intestinalis TaxID=2419774 RepID=A0A387BFN9_9MICO|nr:permease prefix domain 1-containing protein [Protaetiibacter intestinalis]AYF97320.1 hypothetical protein D7I47_02990 [Protaetiibacter intestinalis]